MLLWLDPYINILVLSCRLENPYSEHGRLLFFFLHYEPNWRLADMLKRKTRWRRKLISWRKATNRSLLTMDECYKKFPFSPSPMGLRWCKIFISVAWPLMADVYGKGMGKNWSHTSAPFHYSISSKQSNWIVNISWCGRIMYCDFVVIDSIVCFMTSINMN